MTYQAIKTPPLGKGSELRYLLCCYKYSYAKTVAQAEAEARAVLEVLNGQGMDFPVFYDLEWKEQRTLGKMAIANVFLSKVQKAGYKVGIYCNVDWYNNVLDCSVMNYDYWLAAYPEKTKDNGTIVERLRPAGIGWQYSSKGKVTGIAGAVDVNVFYQDYRKEEEVTVKNGQAAVDLAKSRQNKNQYTQSYLRDRVFSGYSDCSSLVWKCFECAYGIYVGTWTGQQVDEGRRVLLCQDRYCYSKLTQAEINKMQPGDCIYYGAGSATHVEIYMGNGQQIGHGSGTGPTIKDCLDYAHPSGVYQVRRFLSNDTQTKPDNTPWKATGTAASTGDDVNVRVAPDGDILRTVNKGKRFEVDGKVVNGWCHVKVEDSVGYIHEDFVKVDVPAAHKPESYRLFLGEVTASELSVRSWYGEDKNGIYYPLINSYPTLERGNKVDVLVSYKYGSSTWYKVKIAGTYIGFVHGDYIERV